MVEVTREDFERVTRDLLESTLQYTDRTLDKLAGKLGVTDPARRIDEVLLVGGSSRMPAVAEALTTKYGWKPRLHDPDLAVAKGAARFALSRAVWDWDGPRNGDQAAPTAAERQERVTELAARTGVDEAALASIAAKQITNVLPKSFGVKLVDTGRPGWEDDPDAASYIEHLVHADEKLPSGPRSLDAGTTVPNQTEIKIEVYEQAGGTESQELAANKPVDHGSGLITGLPALPANSPIDITMDINDEGMLTVHAVEPSTGNDLKIEVRVSVLSEQEVERATALVSAISVRS
jgi:molecular chaperone DnaK (HSP70)